jgi:LysR family transcriptional regulator, glycine cleavage system transcriptional activator
MGNSDNGPEPELPFRGLVAFEAAARLGSVSRAADELHLTQSAVSQRLQKLESHVGQRLLLRHGHGVRLTGAGDLLMQTAVETLQRLRTGLARIEPYRSKASLLLACPPDVAQGWLLPRLPGAKALHASLEVWLMAEQDMRSIDRVDVDLIVSRRPLHGPDVECVPFLEDASVALCGPRLAAEVGSLPYRRLIERAPLLMLEGEPEWGGLLSTSPRPARMRRAATIQDDRLLLAAVEQELGVGHASRLLADASLQARRSIHLMQVPTRARPRLWLMRSRLAPRTPIADRAFDWLLALAAVPLAPLS